MEDNSNSANEVFNAKKEQIENHIKQLEERLEELTLSERELKEKENKIDEHIKILKQYCEEVPENITREDFIKDHLISFVVKDNGELMIMTKTHSLFVRLSRMFKKE